MIYRLPPVEDAIDQGDIIDGCPLAYIASYDPDHLDRVVVAGQPMRVVVLTQTCDLANQKTAAVVVGVLRDAQELAARGILKPGDIKGPIRAGRVWGWYFLPKSADLGLPEMIADLRQLHSVPMELVTALVKRGQRRGRVQPLYREHLARHFAETYARIGLPEPYETADDKPKPTVASPGAGAD
jgi:hypothetical protein